MLLSTWTPQNSKGRSFDYSDIFDPRINNEFAAAAFRFLFFSAFVFSPKHEVCKEVQKYIQYVPISA